MDEADALAAELLAAALLASELLASELLADAELAEALLADAELSEALEADPDVEPDCAAELLADPPHATNPSAITHMRATIAAAQARLSQAAFVDFSMTLPFSSSTCLRRVIPWQLAAMEVFYTTFRLIGTKSYNWVLKYILRTIFRYLNIRAGGRSLPHHVANCLAKT